MNYKIQLSYDDLIKLINTCTSHFDLLPELWKNSAQTSIIIELDKIIRTKNLYSTFDKNNQIHFNTKE